MLSSHGQVVAPAPFGSPAAVQGGLRLAALGLAVAALSIPASVAAQADAPSEHDLTRGRVHYIASCARCHGVDGGGGEGPSLARADLPRAPDDETLVRIMRGGIPGTGMSGSWWLSQGELAQVAVFVRSLAPSGPGDLELAGDPARGRELYEGARCSRCHTVGGFGTSRGPDLTSVGLRRGASYLRESVLDPAAALPRGQTAISPEFSDYLMVRVVDGDGNAMTGMRMNEDTYTIQLKDGRGRLHSYYKPALVELEKQYDRSLMRSYRDTFTDEELDDLVAYLSTLRGTVRGIS